VGRFSQRWPTRLRPPAFFAFSGHRGVRLET